MLVNLMASAPLAPRGSNSQSSSRPASAGRRRPPYPAVGTEGFPATLPSASNSGALGEIATIYACASPWARLRHAGRGTTPESGLRPLDVLDAALTAWRERRFSSTWTV
jgi:hypothetical protein